MHDDFYKHLMEKSPTGYAYHRIICNEDGIPCDFEFVEVNSAFEKLIGLKGSDIIDKKISNILPNIKKSNFDWIHFYGNIAINDERRDLRLSSEYLKSGYEVYICSPEKYYFTTIFIDITK